MDGIINPSLLDLGDIENFHQHVAMRIFKLKFAFFLQQARFVQAGAFHLPATLKHDVMGDHPLA